MRQRVPFPLFALPFSPSRFFPTARSLSIPPSPLSRSFDQTFLRPLAPPARRAAGSLAAPLPVSRASSSLVDSKVRRRRTSNTMALSFFATAAAIASGGVKPRRAPAGLGLGGADGNQGRRARERPRLKLHVLGARRAGAIARRTPCSAIARRQRRGRPRRAGRRGAGGRVGRLAIARGRAKQRPRGRGRGRVVGESGRGAGQWRG